MIWLAISVVSLLLLYSLMQGAPYVPTKRRDAIEGFVLLDLKADDLFVDIGCGDGVMLRLAAERGYRAVGIEINPLLWVIANWRCRKFKDVHVQFGNLWHWHLPAGIEGVFVFGAGPFMARFARWFEDEEKRLGRSFKVVSLGFPLPGHRAKVERGALFLYEIS